MPWKKTNSGMNWKKTFFQSRYSRWLSSERTMPTVICSTPTTIEIFILYELKKVILLAVRCQIGSMPTGYISAWKHPPSSYHSALQNSAGALRAIQRVPPKKFIGKAKASL